jgi:hypothetical protein
MGWWYGEKRYWTKSIDSVGKWNDEELLELKKFIEEELDRRNEDEHEFEIDLSDFFSRDVDSRVKQLDPDSWEIIAIKVRCCNETGDPIYHDMGTFHSLETFTVALKEREGIKIKVNFYKKRKKIASYIDTVYLVVLNTHLLHAWSYIIFWKEIGWKKMVDQYEKAGLL